MNLRASFSKIFLKRSSWKTSAGKKRVLDVARDAEVGADSDDTLERLIGESRSIMAILVL